MKRTVAFWMIMFLLILFFSDCEKHEINNPFDSECPKELWSPSGLTAVQQGSIVVLNWSQANQHISGFKIDRKVGSGNWGNVGTVAKGSGSWSDSDLKGGLLHEYRLYAYAGSNNSNQLTSQFTPVFASEVTTANPVNVTCTSATLGGNATSDGGSTVSERGIVYATTVNPTTSNTKVVMGTGTGTFSQNVSGLVSGTTYYVRAYSINSTGTSYGQQISFATLTLGTVTTTDPFNKTCTGATLGGVVTNDGGGTISERGVVYATTSNPTTSNTKVIIGNGTGTYSQTVTGLSAATIYYVRAYAINCAGTSYGQQISFTNAVPATVTTANSGIIGVTTSAVLGGSVINDGGAIVTERGVVYAITQNPTTSNSKVAIGSGTGTFSQTVTGFTVGTQYYARAYAINCAGTSYGQQISFSSLNPASVIFSIIGSVSSWTNDIDFTYISTSGNISTYRINSRNFIQNEEFKIRFNHQWDISYGYNNLTITGETANFYTIGTDGNVGVYSERTYEVLIQMDWTNNTATLAMNNLTPSISTVSATSITVNSAISGGNIVNQGSSAVTGRGVCWNTTGNPTIANNRTSNGTGTGTFTSNITGLTSCTSYYVRAYGTNSSGTSYGTQITFKTLGCLVTDNVYVSSFTANSTSLRPGQIISVDGTINANAKTITGCSVGLYFSVNAQWEPKTDVLIKEFKTTFTLGSSTFTTSYTLPLTTPFGTYYIICVADNTNDITETDETDNVKYVKITVL